MFAAAEPAIREQLACIERYAPALESLGTEPPPAPRWTQDWFPRLDAAAAYTMVRRFRPRRIVEVGSGHSTRFLARAASDGATGTKIIAIDPAPRATLAGLDIEWLRMRVQEVGDRPFASLGEGDFLVIDSSHVMAPGSDVELLLERVLPALPAGVHVHFHDIFLPNDYPKAWAWRRYSEQVGVASLLSGQCYGIDFASAWLVAQRAKLLTTGVISRLPLVPGAIESSLWLRKVRA
ncbi:MAG: class I SAM-dependent methyltransferase [Burkholderiales bacterium]